MFKMLKFANFNQIKNLKNFSLNTNILINICKYNFAKNEPKNPKEQTQKQDNKKNQNEKNDLQKLDKAKGPSKQENEGKKEY